MSRRLARGLSWAVVAVLVFRGSVLGARSACAEDAVGPKAKPVPREGSETPAQKTKARSMAVVAAVSKAARDRLELPPAKRPTEDALGDYYVRKAAAACDGDVKALGVGLAQVFETSSMLVKLPDLRDSFDGLETDREGVLRRAAMGRATLRGRPDWLQHFAASFALAVLVGEDAAAALGLAKEMADMQKASGFSFADLMADHAGIAYGLWLRGGDPGARTGKCASEFEGTKVMPDASKLPDGLTARDFEKEYGSVSDDRFIAKRREVTDAVAALAPTW